MFCNIIFKYISLKNKENSVSYVSFEDSPPLNEKHIKEKEEFWFSCEDEEEYKRKQREKNNTQLKCQTSFSSFPCKIFSKYRIKREGNRIIREEGKGWKHCSVGDEMSEGIHRISFLICSCCLIGLIDFAKKLSSDERTITENHIGLLCIVFLNNYYYLQVLVFTMVNFYYYIIIN